MTPYEIIVAKRDGKENTRQQIEFLIDGVTAGSIPDYQISAWLMAVRLKGMSDNEKHFLTQAMLYSGEVVDLNTIPGIKVDKHSTGGVGDKVSIILAPIVAAAGVPVPMISGRGLGHTGGTLDKLESIPGFRIDYSIKEYKKIISEIGVCLIGQTKDIAPADKKIYALRDVTATVESIPLISSSIMSKKLAEGINSLVLDVKTGQGAFMTTYEKSEELAKSLISIGEKAGIRTMAYISNMNQPLGNKIGNWLEIVECIDSLQGNGPQDLMELTHQLSGAMIYLGGKTNSVEDGIKISKEMIQTGKAWEKFIQIVERQEGSVVMVKNPGNYKKAKYSKTIKSSRRGFVNAINALEVGMSAVELGAGRLKAEDLIDHSAGVVLHKKVGDTVENGSDLMTIFSEKENVLENVSKKLLAAVTVSETLPAMEKLIMAELDKNNL